MEIGRGVCDKKNFKVFYADIYEKKTPPPTPWGHGFWRIMKAWTILVEGHQSNIPAKLHWTQSNSVQLFLTRRFLKFSI